ncbi:MAG: hypothetical protein ACI8ZM_003257 [Crocinitomix sp.]|jgi:hypothetical protein
MLKVLLINALLFIGSFSFAQESTYDYQYEFSITGITENGPAKMEMEAVRDLMGVRVIKFDDSLDLFIVLTHLEFNPEELLVKFITNGVEIDGEIIKIDLG